MISPTEAKDRSRQAMAELVSGGAVPATSLGIPPADFQAPELPTGNPVLDAPPVATTEPQIQSSPAPMSTVQVPAPSGATPAAPAPSAPTPPVAGAAPTPEPTQTAEEIRARIAELEVETGTKTQGQPGGTVPNPTAEQAKPEHKPTAEPLDLTPTTVVKLSDGTTITGKELEGQRVSQQRYSRDKRALADEREALEREKQEIEKIKASPVGNVLLAALKSGLPDDKVVEAGAALLGKTIGSGVEQDPEPEIPQINDPDYEKKLDARQAWRERQQERKLTSILQSFEAKMTPPVPQAPAIDVSKQNQELFNEIIGQHLPTLTREQTDRLKEHIMTVSERDDVNVPLDDNSWRGKLLTPRDMQTLRFAAFPEGKIPASILGLNTSAITAPPVVREAQLLEIQRLRIQLNALEEKEGLRPPPMPSSPAPVAGPQPGAVGDTVSETFPQIGNQPAVDRVRQMTQELIQH